MPGKPFALSAKVVIRNAEGECLLLKRAMSSKNNPGKWDLPGGKVDAGENLEDGLLREVIEETGLTISLQRVLGAAEYESPTNRIAYLILEGLAQSSRVRLSSEHDDYIWVDRHDLAKVDLAEQFRPFIETYSRMDE